MKWYARRELLIFLLLSFLYGNIFGYVGEEGWNWEKITAERIILYAPIAQLISIAIIIKQYFPKAIGIVGIKLQSALA